MKKVFIILMFSFMFFFGINLTTNVKAEGDIVDLYPYDNIGCLLADDTCTGTKVGDSHWSFTYYGFRYHVIKGLVRYGSEMVDSNSDGYIDDNELAGIPYNAFASLFVNNTTSEIDILTANARTDITDVVHRKYAHFDENGVLQMFEDHISRYYIYNDGDATTPDWRLATDTEIAAYDAEVAATTITDGSPSSDGLTRKTHIRMALDSTDSDGYVLEPLGYLKWTNADVDVTTAPVSEWSTIIAGDPNNLYIPAGWTVVSFGTNDRGTVNTKTTNFIESLPMAMIDSTVAPMVLEYDSQPGWFNNLMGQDDDASTPGINIVVDYNSTFNLPSGITAEWVNMFDESGTIINSTDKLDYSVEIYQNDNLLQTIDYTWNEVNGAYDASGAQSVIDSSVFGGGYKAVYKVETPIGDVTEVTADIVIGVMPPKFIGVVDRYNNEDMMVNLLEGITADDGYGNDVTNSIIVTTPDDLNVYYPQPGNYEINLQFTHHVHFDGEASTVTINGVESEWNTAGLNSATSLNPDADTNYAIFTDSDMVHSVAWSWGTVLVLVGADGLVDAVYDRYSWDVDDSTGSWNDGGTSFETWKAAVTIEPGGFVIGSHGSTLSTALRALTYDDPITYVNRDIDTVTINGVRSDWDASSGLNSVTLLNPQAGSNYAIFTDSDMVHNVGWSWGTVLVLVGADGLVDGVYDRYSWDIDDSTGSWNDGGASFETWKAAIDIEPGGFVIGSYGSTLSTALRALTYDDPVSFMQAAKEFDYDIVTNASYNLTIDDITKPYALVVNDNYVITAGDFDSIRDAILSNVVAFDENDSVDDLAVYVSDNGGLLLDTPGVYDVKVTVEDVAGNATFVMFSITVVAPETVLTTSDVQDEIQGMLDNQTLTADEIQAMFDDQTLTADEIQALLDAQVLNTSDIQALIDDSLPVAVPETGCGATSGNITGLGIIGIVTLLGTVVLFTRKHF